MTNMGMIQTSKSQNFEFWILDIETYLFLASCILFLVSSIAFSLQAVSAAKKNTSTQGVKIPSPILEIKNQKLEIVPFFPFLPQGYEQASQPVSLSAYQLLSLFTNKRQQSHNSCPFNSYCHHSLVFRANAGPLRVNNFTLIGNKPLQKFGLFIID